MRSGSQILDVASVLLGSVEGCCGDLMMAMFVGFGCRDVADESEAITSA
jgi:hypothetical protein